MRLDVGRRVPASLRHSADSQHQSTTATNSDNTNRTRTWCKKVMARTSKEHSEVERGTKKNGVTTAHGLAAARGIPPLFFCAVRRGAEPHKQWRHRGCGGSKGHTRRSKSKHEHVCVVWQQATGAETDCYFKNIVGGKRYCLRRSMGGARLWCGLPLGALEGIVGPRNATQSLDPQLREGTNHRCLGWGSSYSSTCIDAPVTRRKTCSMDVCATL